MMVVIVLVYISPLLPVKRILWQRGRGGGHSLLSVGPERSKFRSLNPCLPAKEEDARRHVDASQKKKAVRVAVSRPD